MKLLLLLLIVIYYSSVHALDDFKDFYLVYKNDETITMEGKKTKLIVNQFYMSDYYCGVIYKNDTYYFFGIPTDYLKEGYVVYSLDNNLNVHEKKNIRIGKGPEEAMNLRMIFSMNNNFYLFDSMLYRFLVYDVDFNFIDVINFNEKTRINSFFQNGKKIGAFVSDPEGIQFYRVVIDNEVVLKKSEFIKFNKKNFRTRGEEKGAYSTSLIWENNTSMILLTSNVMTIFKKGHQLKKVAEVYLGKSDEHVYEKHFTTTSPGIRSIDENFNVLFYLNEPKIYDFKKNKIRDIKEPFFKFKIEFEDRVYYFKYITNDKYQVVERKK